MKGFPEKIKETILLKEAIKGYSLETIKASVSQGTFTASQATAILSAKGLSDEEIKTTLSTMSLATAEGTATVATGGLGTAIQGLGIKLKALAVAHPILLAISATAIGLIALKAHIDNVAKASDDANEALTEQVSKYNDVKSELEELNKQLDETNSKMAQLTSKDSLTVVEETELKKLKETNAELQTQISLKKASVALEAQKTANDAVNDYNKATTLQGAFGTTGDKNGTKANSSYIAQRKNNFRISGDQNNLNVEKNVINKSELKANKDNINYMLAAYEYLYEEKEKINNKILALDEKTDEESNKQREQLQTQLTNIGEYYGTASGYISEYELKMSNVKSALQSIQDSGINLDQTQQQALQGAISALDIINNSVGKTVLAYEDMNAVQKKSYVQSKLLANENNDEDEVQKYISGLSDKDLELAGSVTFDEKTTVDDVKKAIVKAQEAAKNAPVTISFSTEDILKSLTALTDKADVISSVNEELKNTGNSISAKNLSTITEKFSGLSDEVGKYCAGLISAQDLMDAMENSYTDDEQKYIEKLRVQMDANTDFWTKVLQGNSELTEMLANSAYKDDVANWSSLAKAKYDIESQLITTLGQLWAQYYQNEKEALTITKDAMSGKYSVKENTDEGSSESAAAESDRVKIEDALKAPNEMIDSLINAADDYIAKTSNLSWKGLSGADASKDSTDYWKKAFDAEYNLLKHKLQMEQISQEDYFNGVAALNEKYFANREKYIDEYRQYEEEVYTGLKQFHQTLLNNQLADLKTNLEKGIVSYKYYAQTVGTLLNDALNAGTIDTATYWSNMQDSYASQISIMESVASAASSYYDDLISQEQSYIDELEKRNDVLNEQKTQYENALSAISAYYDKLKDAEQDEIDALDKQNEALQQQIDDRDAVISAVTKTYDDEIDAIEKQKDAIQETIDGLKDANDERERSIALQNAQRELAKAQNQRTNKRLGADGTFIFTQNDSAIKEAKSNLEDATLESTTAALTKEQQALSDTITELQKYRDEWEKISSLHEENANNDIAISLLGADYKAKLLAGEIDLQTFSNAYVAVQTTMANNDLLIQSHNEKIQYYDDLQAKWAEVSTAYQDEMNRQCATLLLGSEWETELQEGRLDSLGWFRDNYVAIDTEINDNQKLIDSYNEKITYYEGLKSQWDNLSENYQKETNKQLLIANMGADYEGQLMNGRLETLANFTNEYIRMQQAQADAAVESARAQVEAMRAIEAMEDAQYSDVGSEVSSGAAYGGYGVPSAVTVGEAYATGTKNAKKGLALVGEEDAELVVTKDGGISLFHSPGLLNMSGGETVIDGEATKKILANAGTTLKTPTDILIDNNPMYKKLQECFINPNLLVPSIAKNYTSPDYSSMINNRTDNRKVEMNVSLNCPNITNNSGVDNLRRELQSLTTKAMQFNWTDD